MSLRKGIVLAALLACPAAARAGMRTEEVWIPMKDGVRLACTLYRPDAPKPGRLPVIFEYLPYRKDDGTLAGDYSLYAYMTARGYVGARVDVRGTGRSEGRVPDREYSEQEQLDGVEVIAWLARQTWSNGNVGMWGWSWGGFNAIQIAARRPPGLKAILPGEATEDLFQDDIHFIDGLFHLDEYELSMEVQPAITRFPDFPLDEKSLADRFDAAPWSLLYKKQQRDGPFWQVSLYPARYEQIQVPVLMIGGWYDGYRDSIPRMLQKLKAPSWAILGPWNHSGPDSDQPGPSIEWRREAVRFFDQFLKGKDTGFSKQPRLAVYVRHSYPPGADRKTIPGEWRYEEGWPIRRSKDATLNLTQEHTLAASADPQRASHALAYVPSTGEAAGFWWGELTPDQRSSDAWSLVYDSGPLPEDMEILGIPEGAPARLGRCAAGKLVRTPFRRRARRPGHARDRRRSLGGAARIRLPPVAARARQGVPVRRRDALHVVGLPEGAPRAPGRLERPLADDLADAVRDDDAALRRRRRRVAARSARDSAGDPPRAGFRGPGALDREGGRPVHRRAHGRASGRSAATR